MKYFYFMFFLFFNYSFVSAQERITSFVSDIVVNKNAALSVKETIEIVIAQGVPFTFSSIVKVGLIFLSFFLA